MQTKIKALQGYKYLLLQGGCVFYIVKRLCRNTYALEQGEKFYNMRTKFHFVGTADEVAAKIDELRLKFIGDRVSSATHFLF